MSPEQQIAAVVPIRTRVGLAGVQGSLALDLTPRLDPPAVPAPRPACDSDVVPVEETLRARLDAWSRRYLQAAVEIAVGDRPVTQVLRWTSPQVYEDLARRAQLVTRAAGTAAGRGRGRHVVRPAVVGARSTFVRDDALEACVHVRYGQRSRAVAARFELVRDRWQCVALEFG